VQAAIGSQHHDFVSGHNLVLAGGNNGFSATNDPGDQGVWL
jgi:hypothetical protein